MDSLWDLVEDKATELRIPATKIIDKYGTLTLYDIFTL